MAFDINLKTKETKALAEVVSGKFSELQELTACLADGAIRALVVTGDGGLGKTHEVVRILKDYEETNNIINIKGQITPLQLFNILQENATESSIVVFDDCDEVLTNVNALNILKAATDTTEERWVNWLTSSSKVDAPTFRFDGRVVVITNHTVGRSNHLKAFLDRCTAYRLELTLQEKLVRICQIAKSDKKYDWSIAESVLLWLVENAEALGASLSMRSFVKVYGLACASGRWQILAKSTLLKGR